MCFNDWRAGRLIRSILTEFHLAATQVFTLPVNQQRVGYTLSLQPADMAAGLNAQYLVIGGVQFPWNNIYSAWHVTLATHGDLPTRGFVYTNTTPALSAITVDGAVIEYLAPEEMITAAIEEFMRQYCGE